MTQEKQQNKLEQSEEFEALDFNNPSFKFQPNEQHSWRQQGPYLVCKSCELVHSVYIGVSKTMIGINDKGQPILEDSKIDK